MSRLLGDAEPEPSPDDFAFRIAPFQGHESTADPSPYPNPSEPETDPYDVIPAPPHVSNEIWQTSYYDPSSQAPVSGYVKRPSGPVDLHTGKLTGEGFQPGKRWLQV